MGTSTTRTRIEKPLRKLVERDLKTCSATQLAREIGCSQPVITMWISGTRGLGMDIAELLARYYGLRLKK